MKRRKKNIYWDRKSMGFKLGKKPRRGRKPFTAVEKKAGTQFRQLRAEAKKEARSRELAKQDQELWQELYGRQNPMRVFPGNLTNLERSALRKLMRLKSMARKKKSRKKRNSRKGKMPAALKAYWAKKRAKKNARKRKRANPKKRRTVRRKRATPKVRRYRRTKPKARRRRTRRSNPVRRRRPRILKPPAGMSAQSYAKALRKAGVRVRVITK